MSDLTEKDFEEIDNALCDCIPALEHCYEDGAPCDLSEKKPCFVDGVAKRLAKYLEDTDSSLRIVRKEHMKEG